MPNNNFIINGNETEGSLAGVGAAIAANNSLPEVWKSTIAALIAAETDYNTVKVHCTGSASEQNGKLHEIYDLHIIRSKRL